MYKLFLTLRYLRKRRIAYFAIGAVALCVAMVLVVHSVMSGFLNNVRQNSRNLLGDVVLEIGSMETFPFYDEFIAELKEKRGQEIAAATPVIINAGLLKMVGGLERDRTALVLVNGILFDEYVKINTFGESLYYNRYFPGTTRFDEQAIPTWYYDENGIPRLPDEYEVALASYREKTQDPDLEGIYRRMSGPAYPGPGFFEASSDLDSESKDSSHYTGDERPGIILGIDMVARREKDGSFTRDIPKGALARLTVLSTTQSGSLTLNPASTAALRYVDDSRTKIYDIDSKNVYCDFSWLQKMLGLDAKEYVDGSGFSPPRATQIQIKLADGVDYNQARDWIEAQWQDFAQRVQEKCEPRDAILMKYMMVMTWEQRNASFSAAVEKERILMLILFGLISVVAIFLVGCIFYMIVQEKTRDIGIIKSMGATSRGVAGVFLAYALAIGVVGSAIGTTAGVLFVRYINEFQDLLIRISPQLQVWSPEVYAFDRIPDQVNFLDVIVIVGVAIFASMLGSVVAAWKAARIWPVDAIRYE